MVLPDPAASEERSGMRVRYSLLTSQMEQRYAALGQALGLKSIQD